MPRKKNPKKADKIAITPTSDSECNVVEDSISSPPCRTYAPVPYKEGFPALNNPYFETSMDTPFHREEFETRLFHYHCTITWRHSSVWNIGLVWTRGIHNAILDISKWCYFIDDKSNAEQVSQIVACIEYQTNLWPHLHMRIVSNYEIPIEKMIKIESGLFRKYGKSQFNYVTDDEGIKDYILKEQEANLSKYNIHHIVNLFSRVL